MSCTLPNSIRTALIEKSEIPHDTDWWQRTLNEVSRYSGSGKSDICDKYTEYSAYARCQRCLGYPSIRSPAAILSWVSIDRYTGLIGDRRYSRDARADIALAYA